MAWFAERIEEVNQQGFVLWCTDVIEKNHAMLGNALGGGSRLGSGCPKMSAAEIYSARPSPQPPSASERNTSNALRNAFRC